jgi:hypothetical protein
MQPLDDWVDEAVRPSGFWMYHGEGANMLVSQGPASWFMVSLPGSEIISKWAQQCREYWLHHSFVHDYFWMDGLFRYLYESNESFRLSWNRVPFVNCEAYGQSHCLAGHLLFHNDGDLKHRLLNHPPYAIKLSKLWTQENPHGTLYSDSLAAFVLDVATRTCVEQ